MSSETVNVSENNELSQLQSQSEITLMSDDDSLSEEMEENLRMDTTSGSVTTSGSATDDALLESPCEHPSLPLPSLPLWPSHFPSSPLSPADSYDNLHDPYSISETTPPDIYNANHIGHIGYHDPCHYGSECSVKLTSPLAPRPSPKNVAEEISSMFKNCLPHANGESDLHRAAFEGDSKTVCQLLNQISTDPLKSEMINQRNRLGCTPIRLAATGGHLECLTYLINAGANIDIVDVKCQTPLFVAVKNRRFACAKKLLECQACPDGDPGNSSTPLYIAFMNGDVQYVMLLLEHGAHPDKLRHISRVTYNVYNPKCTSLDAAIEYLTSEENIHKAVKMLLSCGCKTDNFDYHTCVYHDRAGVIELLYNFGVKATGKDLNNRLATELNVDNAAKRKLIHLRANPRSLMSTCRNVVISTLTKPRRDLGCLNSLPLPSALISYLQFSDF